MSKRTFEQHFDPNVGPKRILALDGGGLRGVLTLAFLKRIEALLADKTGTGGDFRLSDYYDLIGGTSTGSIIAAGLALGMSVDEIRGHYFQLGEQIFKPGLFNRGILRQRYDGEQVGAALRRVFGERTLGSPDFKTGLIVLTKRLDTGSQWVLSNNPNGRYYHGESSEHTVPNKDFPLWRVVRASTAAPTYFEPEQILVAKASGRGGGSDVLGEFIDGGVSTANNPALQLVLAATAKGYGFNWQMGEDQLEVTSVGTGRASQELGLSTGFDSVVALHAVKALKSVLDDCEDLVEVMLQWLSNSPTARRIDREIGKLEASHPGNGTSLRYHRYNAYFDPVWFKEELGQDLTNEKLDELAMMDKPGNMHQLEEIGRVAADRFVSADHFSIA